MDKRGFLRIVEASIAIVIIMSALFIVNIREPPSPGITLTERAEDIVKEVSQNPRMRLAVLEGDTSAVTDYVGSRVREPFLAYEVRACELDDVCGQSEYVDREVFVGERIVSANVAVSEFSPKRLRLFLWRAS